MLTELERQELIRLDEQDTILFNEADWQRYRELMRKMVDKEPEKV